MQIPETEIIVTKDGMELLRLHRISVVGTSAANREYGVRSRGWRQSWACWVRRIQTFTG